MADFGSRTDPNDVGLKTEYAGFVAPKRADASTVAPGGNVVDRDAINKTNKGYSTTPTAAKPAGPVTERGY